MSHGTRELTRLGYADLPRLIGLQAGDAKHAPSAESTLDVIWVLYDRVLNVAADRSDDPDRDRFLLSKGHGPMAYYAVLAAKGFLTEDDLRSYGGYESPLGQHPDRNRARGVEISSGSLGHGLGIAVGLALGLRARRSAARVFCLVGDAELDEGSNHEAIAFAGRTRLDKLTVVAIDNRSSSYGWPGGVAARFALEDWSTTTVDGRDHTALEHAFEIEHEGRPHAVIAVVEPKA